MSNTMVKGVKGTIVQYIVNGYQYPITLINMYDVDEFLAFQFKETDHVQEHSFGWQWKDIEKMETVFRSWLNIVNAHYYSASKENFFIWEAVQEAIEVNKIVIVLDNMS